VFCWKPIFSDEGMEYNPPNHEALMASYIESAMTLDWRTLTVIAILILVVTVRWWLPSWLSILQGKQIKATWADRSYGLAVEQATEVTAPAPSSLRSSQISSLSYRVAVINSSTSVKDSEIESAVVALQKQIHRDFAPAWGVDAELTFVPKGSEPEPDSWRMLILDDTDQSSALGYRNLTSDGFPETKIFARSAQKAGVSWTVSASHVLLEMLANPRQNLTVFVQSSDSAGKLFVHEVCNPCTSEEYAYEIDGILVSDFIFPAWFESHRKPKSTKFDFRGHITEPLMIPTGGYAPFFDVQSGEWTQVFAGDGPKRMNRKKSKK